MKLIIDRFEGDFAIVELPDGRLIDCPKCLIPNNANEGSIISAAAIRSKAIPGFIL